jgi:hypothetical protein
MGKTLFTFSTHWSPGGVDYFVLFSHLNGDLTTLTPTELQRRLINSFISKQHQQQRFLKTSQLINLTRRGMAPRSIILIVLSFLLLTQSESAPQAFKREPGHPQWHHSAFHDVRDSVRSDIRRMLHSRAEVIFTPSTQFRILIESKLKFIHSYNLIVLLLGSVSSSFGSECGFDRF